MQRTIKFRAYDHDKMVYNPETFVSDTSSINDAILNWTNSNCPLMQFTGLKDKNGVDIYEGDIIFSEHYPAISSYKIEWDKQDAMFVCRWNLLDGDGTNTIALSYLNLNFVHIIGNIYQNPELLNEQ